ncbi:MAG: hypothetical protein WCP87_00395 [Atribacterota bacterium]
MINSRQYWNEMRDSGRLILRRPEFLLLPLVPGVLGALIFFLSHNRRLTWVSSYFQSVPLTILSLLALFSSFLCLCFMIALIWDFQYRDTIDFRRAWKMISGRFTEILIASAALGLLIGVFSVWFVFPGFFLAYLLLFSFPALVVEGDDPFSAVKTSFRMVMENSAEVFAFLIVAVCIFLIGYLLIWILSLIPFAGFFLDILVGSLIITYLSLLLTRFYLTLSRYGSGSGKAR